jgi:acetyl-CoA acetyltransferase
MSAHAIVGLGLTAQGHVPGRSALDLKVEALTLALDDAGLAPRDIDGYIFQPGVADKSPGQGGELVKRMGMSPNFVWNLQAGGTTAIAAVIQACAAIDAGLANAVAIGYSDNARSAATLVGASASDVGDPSTTYGMFSPGADHALAARRHMAEFGTTKEQLGAVALEARRWAALRPEAALHGRALTMQDYLAAPTIADPFGKYDYCLTADGGSTIIVTSRERSADLPGRSVHISGYGLAMSLEEVYQRTAYSRLGASRAGRQAYERAGITPSDIDTAQVYDCFTITVIMALEAFGFCGIGEGGAFAASGAIGPGGSLPTNTAGGELAWGYQQGFTPLVEAVRQLRGQALGSQVHDARHALVSGHGSIMQALGNMDYSEAALVLSAEAAR